MQPIIGITGRPKYIASVGTQLRAYAVFQTYTEGVFAAGATPIMLVPSDDHLIDGVLDRLDGLILTGGGDIDPRQYGDERGPKLVEVDEERDQFEIALVKRAMARKMPTFAICRGLQVVNVALGGTLVQDLPSEHGIDGHDVMGDSTYIGHSNVALEPGCRIAEIIGHSTHVNSLHHQAVRTVGEGLRVVGQAEDGTVEALEPEDASWPLLAVQWHPEFLRVRDHDESNNLFSAFVEMAEKYRADL